MDLAGAVGRDARRLGGLRILVVDDDEDVRDALVAIVQLFGGDGIAAPSAVEARALLAAEHFDVLVSDLEMPDEDGYALIRSVRGSPAAEQLAAVAVTGSLHDDDSALAAGFDCVLRKPPAVGALVDVVQQLGRGATR